MAKTIIDTGVTTGTKDKDGKQVIRKVYEVVEMVEKKIIVNTALLETRKAELEAELADINDMLSQMED